MTKILFGGIDSMLARLCVLVFFLSPMMAFEFVNNEAAIDIVISVEAIEIKADSTVFMGNVESRLGFDYNILKDDLSLRLFGINAASLDLNNQMIYVPRPFVDGASVNYAGPASGDDVIEIIDLREKIRLSSLFLMGWISGCHTSPLVATLFL